MPLLFKGTAQKLHESLLLMSHWLGFILLATASCKGRIVFSLGNYVSSYNSRNLGNSKLVQWLELCTIE